MVGNWYVYENLYPLFNGQMAIENCYECCAHKSVDAGSPGILYKKENVWKIEYHACCKGICNSSCTFI